MNRWNCLVFLVLLTLFACRQEKTTTTVVQKTNSTEVKSPEELYGDLFEAVQLDEVFPDSKTFVDCTPKYSAEVILDNYEKEKVKPGFNIEEFVKTNFNLPIQYSSGFESEASRTAVEHINALWPVLTRQPDTAKNTSLLSLPNPYIVPGGRFGEIYYWDSYFTMLGLRTAGKEDMIENMLDNFAYLIDTHGFIPNGNRAYYLGRSQPPFFSAMVRCVS